MSHVLSEIITVVNFDNVQLSPTLSSFGITELRRSLDHQSTSNSVQMSEIEGKKNTTECITTTSERLYIHYNTKKGIPILFHLFQGCCKKMIRIRS